MDKRRSILNICVSVGFKIITMVMSIAVKRLLIMSCGNEVNGLNALFLSIIGFLSVAELGIGTAITFCMYKPIVQGETDKVAALYHLFRRIYFVVGAIILASGLLLTPFIHHFAKDFAQLNVDLYSTFVLMLVSVVITYFFGAKTALINAYKNNYITTAINSCGILLQYILQIAVLRFTHSFTWYLVCRIVSVLVQWIVTEMVTRKKYASLLRNKQKVDQDGRSELMRNIKAMFMHKIGHLLVNTFDSIIISIFVGVVALGEYSNYTAILNAMTSVITLIFTSLTSVWGHLYVQQNKDTARRYCELFHLLNYMVGVVFYLGYFAVIDNLIAILFSAELVLSRSLSAVITMNGFVHFMRQSVMTFREATGTFYYDRWKPLVDGTVNVILSVLFVKWIGMAGVIVATIITNLMVCHIVEPYVLYKNAFGISAKKYYAKNYGMIASFAALLLLQSQLIWKCETPWMQMVVNGCISVGLSTLVCVLIWLVRPNLRQDVRKLIMKGAT